MLRIVHRQGFVVDAVESIVRGRANSVSKDALLSRRAEGQGLLRYAEKAVLVECADGSSQVLLVLDPCALGSSQAGPTEG